MFNEIFASSFTAFTSNSFSFSSLSSSTSSSESGAFISFLFDKNAKPAAIAAKRMKSLLGIPGTKPRASITSEVGIQAADKFTCLEICSDMLCAEDTRVTIIAVAMDNKSDGI